MCFVAHAKGTVVAVAALRCRHLRGQRSRCQKKDRLRQRLFTRRSRRPRRHPTLLLRLYFRCMPTQSRLPIHPIWSLHPPRARSPFHALSPIAAPSLSSAVLHIRCALHGCACSISITSCINKEPFLFICYSRIPTSAQYVEKRTLASTPVEQ